MTSSEKKEAKYSLLLASNNIDISFVEKKLHKGIKIIIFSTDEIEKTVTEDFEDFIKAGFLNVYINRNNVEIQIIDGIDADSATLDKLEEGDSRFNIEQYLIEHASLDKNIIVEAGAGTGKTHVMVNRIMYLMHMDPNFTFSDVAMITFTNKATDNMRHRLVKVINEKYRLTGEVKYLDRIEELSQINISTIHSFFKKVLVEAGPMLGYGKNVQLKSYIQEKKELLRDMLDKNYSGTKRVDAAIGLPIHEIEDLALMYWEKLDSNGFSEQEIRGLNWGTTADEKAEKLQNTLKAIFNSIDDEYNEIKYINNAISMKDIIHELGRVMQDTKIDDYISTRYKYMFCDEFQDSDNVQIQTIALLNRLYDGHLFVVGDIKQSIYRFRGATDSAFEKLDNCFTDEEKTKKYIKALTKNYRTSANVLKQLDEVFKGWGDNGLKLLKYKNADCLKPQLTEKGIYVQRPVTNRTRRKKVIDTIKSIQAKSKASRITCLVRKNIQLKTIKEWCEKEEIVCLIKERGSFYTSVAVLDFCTLVEAYLFDNEPMFLYNYIMSSYGVGYVDYEALNEANGNKAKIFKVLLEYIDIEEWRDYKEDLKYLPVMAVLRDLITKSNPSMRYGIKRKALLLQKGYPKEKANDQAALDALQYEANLNKLLRILTARFSGDFSTLADISAFVRLQIMTDRSEEQEEIGANEKFSYVEGLTVHGAKGLEFENVMIPFMNDEFYQTFRSEILIDGETSQVGWVYRPKRGNEILNDQYQKLTIDEERAVAKEETRLLYVAMTRAINSLYCFPGRENISKEHPKTWADLLPEEKDNESSI